MNIGDTKSNLNPSGDDQIRSIVVAERVDTLSKIDKIQILLSEYNTLRAELIGAGHKMYNILSVGSGLFVFLITQYSTQMFWPALGAGTVIVAIFSALNIIDIRRLALRVRNLEDEINNRAGEPLLTWENQFGIYRKRR